MRRKPPAGGHARIGRVFKEIFSHRFPVYPAASSL
jgi:hypothetical protein